MPVSLPVGVIRQVGRDNATSLTPYGKELARRYPNETPTEWLRKTGYSEENAARIWTSKSRSGTGQQMLLLHVLAVVLWTGGNELLKRSDQAP